MQSILYNSGLTGALVVTRAMLLRIINYRFIIIIIISISISISISINTIGTKTPNSRRRTNSRLCL